MTFTIRFAPKSTIEVSTSGYELDGFFHIDDVHPVDEIETSHGAEGESRVHFAPFVTEKAAIGLLETRNELKCEIINNYVQTVYIVVHWKC